MPNCFRSGQGEQFDEPADVETGVAGRRRFGERAGTAGDSLAGHRALACAVPLVETAALPRREAPPSGRREREYWRGPEDLRK